MTNFLAKIWSWFTNNNWRILLATILFIILLTLFFKYILGFLEWKDPIQTATQIVVVFGLIIAWKQIKVASKQAQTAWEQIEATKELHKIQFEDSLAKEYRDLIQKIPLKALLGEDLTAKEYKDAKSYLFQYINLTNDQIFLRSKNRISLEVWDDWQGGIKYNLSLPTFKKFWEEIKSKITSFEELRKLEEKEFDTDPKHWKLESKSKKKQLK